MKLSVSGVDSLFLNQHHSDTEQSTFYASKHLGRRLQ